MQASPRYRVVGADIGRACSFENLSPARQSMLHHLPAVLADRIIDLRRGNAVTVLQHGIERDAVVLLGQVLTDRGDPEAMAVEPAKHAVMVRAPWQNALLLAPGRCKHGPGAAGRLH